MSKYIQKTISNFKGIDKNAVFPSKLKISSSAVKNQNLSSKDAESEIEAAFSVPKSENFDLLDDLSIKKRAGFYPLASLSPSSPVRAWEVVRSEDGDTLFYLAGRDVYALDSDGTSTQIGQVSAGHNTDPASFFSFDGKLCLCDGLEIYLVTLSPASLTALRGYVPLYGKNWDGHDDAPVNEPVNNLSEYIAITYSTYEGATSLYIGGEGATEIVSYIRDGISLSPSLLTFDSAHRHVSLSECSESTRITLVIKINNALRRLKLAKNFGSAVFGNADAQRVFLYSPNQSALVRFSSPLSSSQLDTEEALAYGYSDLPLYFPDKNADTVCLGDGRSALTALLPHGEKLYIFTKSETWALESERDSQPLPVNRSYGCASPKCATICGKDFYALGQSGVVKFDGSKGGSDAVVISAPIDDNEFSLGAKAGRCALFGYSSRGLLVLADPSATNGELLICRTALPAWYSYTGIAAGLLSEFDGKMIFMRSDGIYKFDESRAVDMLTSGLEKAVTAKYVMSGILMRDVSSSFLHRGRCALVCSALGVGSKVAVTLKNELGVPDPMLFELDGDGNVERIVARTRLGRFRELEASLTCDGNYRQRIRQISFYGV